MQVDASEVFQPQNPGDALIRKFKIIGPAPDAHSLMLDGLALVAKSNFEPSGTPAFLIEIRNTGMSPVKIDSSEIGPTLLGPSSTVLFGASDGRSVAVITRGDLVHPSSSGSTIDGVKYYWSYTIDPKSCPPNQFVLEPGESMETRITFKVPAGQYQFIFGYGGGVHEGKSLASNAIAFDLNNDGVASLAK
jgi:hypothetical protein